MTTHVEVTQKHVLAELIAAEREAGWLAACEQAGRHLIGTRELTEALAELLQGFSPGPLLEVCAGQGELAGVLRQYGIHMVATDADPPAGSNVMRLDAVAALARFQPRTVVGCFVPIDSEVDQTVFSTGCVDRYLVIAARINGQLGSSRLWSAADWKAVPLPQISRCLITRHDTWLGESRGVLQRGEAWLFERKRLSDAFSPRPACGERGSKVSGAFGQALTKGHRDDK
jgi:hypothetical protein